jgi:hypothetical protein
LLLLLLLLRQCAGARVLGSGGVGLSKSVAPRQGVWRCAKTPAQRIQIARFHTDDAATRKSGPTAGIKFNSDQIGIYQIT